MEIVVLIKRVPDPNIPAQFVGVSGDGREVVVHPAAQYALNLYDLNALECALDLKERHGATVTAISVDQAAGEPMLRRALSMGADRAIRVEGGNAVHGSPQATARAIVAAIRKSGTPDLVIAGRQASDTDAGYVPFLVAHGLGLPALSPVVAIRPLEGPLMRVARLGDSGIELFEIRLPATILVSNEMNKPRTPSLKGVMLAKKVPIEVFAPEPATLPQPEAAASYAKQAEKRSGNTVTYGNCSTDEKVAALLAALGK